MRIINLSIFAICLFLLQACVPSASKLYSQKPAFYAYVIGDVKGQYIDAKYADDTYITPASCQKVITALLALKLLGPDYSYETKLFVTKKQKSIQDVVIAFAGDPTLTLEDLQELLKPLSGKKINGKILLDDSAFKTAPHSENIMLGDIGTSYGQPVYAINLDKNTIHFQVKPTKIGKSAEVISDSEVISDGMYKIKSSIVTSFKESTLKLTWSNNQIIVKGNININDETWNVKASPVEIEPYIMHKLTKVLKALSIKAKVEIIRDKNKLPTDLVLINKITSKPLKEIIPPALKISDNFVFDSLYLKIIHLKNADDIENWTSGDKIIKDLVKQYFDIDVGGALFVDGSGISRYNRIQPKQLFTLLKAGFLVPEFVSALPRPGEKNGTLYKRGKLPEGIRAKTGNLLGISCLCGYNIEASKSKSSTPKAFVIMVNSFAPPAKDLFDIIDEFVKNYVK